jgi:hypothetical protein
MPNLKDGVSQRLSATITDAYAQWRHEEQLYGSDVCEAFCLYCSQRREKARFWRRWQERYGCPPTPREASISDGKLIDA